MRSEESALPKSRKLALFKPAPITIAAATTDSAATHPPKRVTARTARTRAMAPTASPRVAWIASAAGPELIAQPTLRSDPEKYSGGCAPGWWAGTLTYRFTTMPTAT